MSVKIKELNEGKLVHLIVSGKLSKDDYEEFSPVVEGLIGKHGKICMLVEMQDFHGWTVSAAWEDIKFDIRHYSDIEKLALVGESKWEKGMSVFCRPFTSAKIKYFNVDSLNKAQEWIQADK